MDRLPKVKSLGISQTGRLFFEFSINNQSFMSPLRSGYLQCAKNTLWNVQQSNTKKKF